MVKTLWLHTPFAVENLFRMVNRISRVCGEYQPPVIHKLRWNNAICQNCLEKKKEDQKALQRKLLFNISLKI